MNLENLAWGLEGNALLAWDRPRPQQQQQSLDEPNWWSWSGLGLFETSWANYWIGKRKVVSITSCAISWWACRPSFTTSEPLLGQLSKGCQSVRWVGVGKQRLDRALFCQKSYLSSGSSPHTLATAAATAAVTSVQVFGINHDQTGRVILQNRYKKAGGIAGSSLARVASQGNASISKQLFWVSQVSCTNNSHPGHTDRSSIEHQWVAPKAGQQWGNIALNLSWNVIRSCSRSLEPTTPIKSLNCHQRIETCGLGAQK